MQIIRRSSFVPNPWKNGGGITYEAIRTPAGADVFRWRLSIAEIENSGPFSDFSGYSRRLVLLEGRGMHLAFGDGRRVTLDSVGDLVQFDGAEATRCELIEGACTDLNLLLATSLERAEATVERLATARRVNTSDGITTLIFSIRGSARMTAPGSESMMLETGDLGVITAGHACDLSPANGATAGAPLIFLASFRDAA